MIHRFKRFRRTFVSLAIAVMLAGVAGCDGTSNQPTQPPAEVDPADTMRDAIRARQWQRALEYAPQALVRHPSDPRVMKDAATANAMAGKKRDAAKLLVDRLALTDYSPASDVNFAFQALIDVGELYESIDLLKRSIRADPENLQHRRMLLGMLGEAERYEQIGPHYEQIIRERAFDFPLLLAMTEATTRRFSAKTGQRMMERNPSDHRVRLGEARNHLDLKEVNESLEVLDDILTHHPNFAPAYALLGQALVEDHQLEALPGWIQRAPAGSEEYLEYWLTLGDWASYNSRHAEAARAYWEATKRDPNDPGAFSRLAIALRRIEAEDKNQELPFTPQELADMDQRVSNLLSMRKHLFGFEKSARSSQRYAIETAKDLSELGRNWEAEAWSAAATSLTKDPSDEINEFRTSVVDQLRADQDWLSKRDHPALRMDLSSLPIPKVTEGADLDANRSAAVANVVPQITSAGHVRMSEQSEAWGLTGIGAGNFVSEARLGPLIRSTGIGGGAIDFDLDGLPDVLVVGAGGTMLERDSQPNELMRNLGNRFSRVTLASGAGDTGFGQGLAVGDYNEDGFPDLFFANLGRNRLLRNNGDGTFTDCSDQLVGEDPRQWTTCGAFFDIDGDALTDLITTNYCEVVDNLDGACRRSDGVLGPCHPLKFPADHDQYFVGTQEGQLEDVTSRWMPPVSPGRGLGILAGSLAGDEIGILIANDMSSNEYYTRSTNHDSPLIESASARGVAVDARTLPQASMGIASGDFDGDGDLDIYVTGFGKEYNIYYEQIAPGLWKDETRKVGLVDPTLLMVGFGTEAIDLDSDGIEELVVTNGHIGDFQDDELKYEQPFQVFRRDGSGVFQSLEIEGWGDYFSKRHVGRALWTLDANGDGQNDVMLTHTDEQARLILVDSYQDHHRIGFKLVGTATSRDATGAVIRFRAGGKDRTLWCLAGDGYMCANEKVLRAGLGASDQVEDVTVTWADGSVEQIGSLEADGQYVIVQGEGAADRVKDHR